MIRISNIKIDVLSDNKENIIKKLEKELKEKVIDYKIVKKSIDARKDIKYVYTFDVTVNNEEKVLRNKNVIKTPIEEYKLEVTGTTELKYRPVIIGTGPSGLFLGYMLSKYGYKPLLIERGEKIEDRVKTVEKFWQDNNLNTESNVQFGEGGAGTFSDGKLNTLVKDKYFRMKKVFEIFMEAGAPEEIMYDYKPHIGTDKLREVVINLRNKIIDMGGEFRYSTKLTDLIIKDNKLEGIIVNDKEEIKTNNIFLCIGHSARDTYEVLRGHNLDMKSKPFAVGVRIEHKQEDINKCLYKDYFDKLGPASYKLTYNTSSGRGVYSFCMCPGGYVVNASSEKGRLAVNGMSDYKRDSGIANSALVVSVTPNDYGEGLFDGVKFQRELEEKAYKLGNGLIPCQSYMDFINKKETKNFEFINTKGNYKSSDLNKLLPDFISDSIKEAMPHFKKQINCFDKGILLGIESRTSSPITILRDENGESNIKGIYPVGEGAGYSGGITTSAMDALKQVENYVKKYIIN